MPLAWGLLYMYNSTVGMVIKLMNTLPWSGIWARCSNHFSLSSWISGQLYQHPLAYFSHLLWGPGCAQNTTTCLLYHRLLFYLGDINCLPRIWTHTHAHVNILIHPDTHTQHIWEIFFTSTYIVLFTKQPFHNEAIHTSHKQCNKLAWAQQRSFMNIISKSTPQLSAIPAKSKLLHCMV